MGEENVAAPTLKSLSSNFGTQCLIDKPLATITDARFTGPQGLALVLVLVGCVARGQISCLRVLLFDIVFSGYALGSPASVPSRRDAR